MSDAHTRKVRTLWVAYLDVLDRGGQVNLVRLVTGLDRRRHVPLVLVARKGPLFEHLTGQGIPCLVAPVFQLPPRGLAGGFLRTRWWLRLFAFRPHIIYVDGVEQIPIIHRLTQGLGAPILWHAQTMMQTDRDADRIAQAAHVVAVAPHVADHIRRIQPKASIESIPNGVDVERFSPRPEVQLRADADTSDRDLVVLYVGGLHLSKGVGDLLHAFVAVLRAHPRAWLWLVGTGEDEGALRTMSSDLEIGENVKYFGHRSDVERFYRAADVMVLASHSEGLPLALMEAMASGTACVGSDIPAIRYLLRGGAGVLAEVKNPDALAAAVNDLLGSAERRSELGREARRRAVDQHQVERFMTGFDRTLQRMAGRARKT